MLHFPDFRAADFPGIKRRAVGQFAHHGGRKILQHKQLVIIVSPIIASILLFRFSLPDSLREPGGQMLSKPAHFNLFL
jgi:hypothetical protein